MSDTIKNNTLRHTAGKLVAESNVAILATADSQGHPHASYMHVLADNTMKEVVAISAPGTEKTDNLLENPNAEWMFSSTSLESQAYLSGPTEIITGDEAVKYWHEMSSKAKAPYRNYSDSENPKDFAIIRTKVHKVVYCRPRGYQKTLVFEL